MKTCALCGEPTDTKTGTHDMPTDCLKAKDAHIARLVCALECIANMPDSQMRAYNARAIRIARAALGEQETKEQQ